MAEKEKNSIDIEKWLKLIRSDNVGPVTFAKLIKHFGSIDRTLGTSVSQLTAVDGIGYKTAELISRSRDRFDTAAELRLAEKLGIWIINLEDARYPVLLKRVYAPPPVLYIKGNLSRSDNLSVAIVGSRHCSLYGQEQASRFAHLLGSAGFTIVSGMARGIDTSAHHGALSAQARTIAVQGCGLKNIFPPENEKLFELISHSGACISELPVEYEPKAENFPARNRIIAGLSLGTIVIEAGYHSGALITAKAALENNREVMAVPGKIDSPLSKGPNQLIKDGARLLDSVDDVMETLGYIGQQIKEYVSKEAKAAEQKIERPLIDTSMLNLNNAEKVIYDCLTYEPLHTEQIIAETDLEPGGVNSGLVSLRLKGLIKHLPGNMFLRK